MPIVLTMFSWTKYIKNIKTCTFNDILKYVHAKLID